MEQKNLDKYFDSMKQCLVNRGYEISIAKKQKDITLGQKLILHIIQHSIFRTLYNYQLTMDQITEDQIIKLINDMKRNCPYLSVETLSSLAGRLPIRIGRWLVGNTDYVSPG